MPFASRVPRRRERQTPREKEKCRRCFPVSSRPSTRADRGEPGLVSRGRGRSSVAPSSWSLLRDLTQLSNLAVDRFGASLACLPGGGQQHFRNFSLYDSKNKTVRFFRLVVLRYRATTQKLSRLVPREKSVCVPLAQRVRHRKQKDGERREKRGARVRCGLFPVQRGRG